MVNVTLPFCVVLDRTQTFRVPENQMLSLLSAYNTMSLHTSFLRVHNEITVWQAQRRKSLRMSWEMPRTEFYERCNALCNHWMAMKSWLILPATMRWICMWFWVSVCVCMCMCVCVSVESFDDATVLRWRMGPLRLRVITMRLLSSPIFQLGPLSAIRVPSPPTGSPLWPLSGCVLAGILHLRETHTPSRARMEVSVWHALDTFCCLVKINK